MGKIKTKWRDMPIRKTFNISVLITTVFIVLVSAVVILSCISFRNYMMPDKDEIYLTVITTYEDGRQEESTTRMKMNQTEGESALYINDGNTKSDVKNNTYKITNVESGYNYLSPKRKFAYNACGVIIIAFPIVLSITGILFCGFEFYKRKLYEPINELNYAMKEITADNLDFKVRFTGKDELGTLCKSVERMRKALYNNNRELWGIIDKQHKLQASVAHDLRNPIAIIKGYAEYLGEHKNDTELSEEYVQEIYTNILLTSKRMERYTNSIRDIHCLEEIETKAIMIDVAKILEDIKNDLQILAEQTNIQVDYSVNININQILLDVSLYYRVLENIFTNALRYARTSIQVNFAIDSKRFVTQVVDDGLGFPKAILKSDDKYFYTTENKDEHMGMGIAISRILCLKLNGNLILQNITNGACAEICIKI